MTTAHRPTFHAAIGGKDQGGGRYVGGVSRQHVHDLPSQMSLKSRAKGVPNSKEDLRAALEAREAEHLQAIGKAVAPKLVASRDLPPLPPPDDEDDDDDDVDGGGGGGGLVIDPEDADDKLVGAGAVASGANDDDEDDEDDEDDDDEEELMRELERIKKERAQEAARKEREANEEAVAERDSAMLQGNPLLDPTRAGASDRGSFAVKRRWDDDVVFKNQSREPKKEGRRFINDTVRNDFHRRFLSKYVQ